jgi:dolichol-phosphate mannosyltransferase
VAKNLGWQFEVILVDDNSTDGTKKIIEQLACSRNYLKPIYRISGKHGMGLALRDGTISASGDFIVWIMADRSDQLDTIPELIRQLDMGADVAIASRYMKDGSSGDLNKIKAFFSKGYSMMAKLFLGMIVHDITNAFRAFKKEKFLIIKIKSDDFCISPEFSIKAHLKGFKMVEVPTIYKDRKIGKSKFKLILMGIKYVALFIESIINRPKQHEGFLF